MFPIAEDVKPFWMTLDSRGRGAVTSSLQLQRLEHTNTLTAAVPNMLGIVGTAFRSKTDGQKSVDVSYGDGIVLSLDSLIETTM